MSGETILKIDLLNRRDVLRGLGGLLVGFVLPTGRNAEAQRYGAPLPVKPNAYIHIDSDNIVTFVITKVEMGQGTVTSLSQILADELDCDWNCVRASRSLVLWLDAGRFRQYEYPYPMDASAQGRRGDASDAVGSCGAEVEYRCEAGAHGARISAREWAARQLWQRGRSRGKVGSPCQHSAQRREGFQANRHACCRAVLNL
jgi:hypothetical protein